LCTAPAEPAETRKIGENATGYFVEENAGKTKRMTKTNTRRFCIAPMMERGLGYEIRIRI
jgi:hypothetical protein